MKKLIHLASSPLAFTGRAAQGTHSSVYGLAKCRHAREAAPFGGPLVGALPPVAERYVPGHLLAAARGLTGARGGDERLVRVRVRVRVGAGVGVRVRVRVRVRVSSCASRSVLTRSVARLCRCSSGSARR